MNYLQHICRFELLESRKTPSPLMPACACPHADRGEGRGEGENTAISTSYVPLPFIPSHQGRGNPTFYETVINYLS